MATLLETAADHLRVGDWNFGTHLESNVLYGNLNGDHAEFSWVMDSIEDEGFRSIRMSTTLPAHIPEAKHPAITELLMRINNRLSNGKFVLNYTDGVIRYNVVLDIMDGVLTQAMLERLFITGPETADHFFPTIMGVVYGGTSPAMALEMLEVEGEARQ